VGRIAPPLTFVNDPALAQEPLSPALAYLLDGA
jgi:hypothetical protein